jgi:hypothetical protein
MRHFNTLPAVAVFLILALSNSRAAIDEHGFPAKYPGTPYNGEPLKIPGTIQAAEYDIAPNGANNITFHYDGDSKQTDLRKSPDSIGLARCGNGHVSIDGKPENPNQIYVGWTQVGEWLRYSVKVGEAGTYVIGGKLSAGASDAKISFSFGPNINTGPIPIPTTAGHQPNVEVYHVWETLDNLAEVKLEPGIYLMTVKIEAAAGMNFAYFTFTKK